MTVFKELSAAIEDGNLERVRMLLEESKERIHEKTPFGTWLHVAATSGQVEIVKLLLAMGADVNSHGGPLGGAAINEAATEGHVAVVKALLDAGASLDTSEPERNPLFSAIYGGNIEVVKLLLASGIDPWIKYSGESMKNMDALAFARERGRNVIAEYLERLRK